jgi:hypothetical protein
MLIRPMYLCMAVFVMSILVSCAAAPPSMRPGKMVPEGKLVGRLVKAKIDLPLYRGMLIYGNGEIDFGVYRNKLEALGPSIRIYERARITKVKQKGNQLRISLNSGGWNLGLNPKGQLRWLRPEQRNNQGTLIFIDYGRPPTSDDAHPERVAYALRDVLEIEGIGAAASPAPLTAPVSPSVLAAVKLLSVEVQPSRVVMGQQLDLAVHFEVKGASTEDPLSLTINRQVFHGEKPLFSAPRTQQGHWAAGIHSAHFTLTVPSTTAPGVYRFVASVSHGGKEESREALFEVLQGRQ